MPSVHSSPRRPAPARPAHHEALLRPPRFVGLAEAAASTPDDASIAPGGFMLGRAPMALVFALVRQGRRRLKVVSLPNPLPAEILVAAGAVARAAPPFTATTPGGPVRSPPCPQRALPARGPPSGPDA